MLNMSITGRLYFNSRPSARGDRMSGSNIVPAVISIHAPPRGATGEKQTYEIDGTISIHAPPRGATFFPICWNCCRTFQFTPLREGRPGHSQYFARLHTISIHAPPRGATLLLAVKYEMDKFQFTPLREGRHTEITRRRKSILFQFTPLREGRQQKICNFCKSFVQPLQISMA